MLPILLALTALPAAGEAAPAALERNHIPGAVVAIVRRGQPPVVRGYGVANAGSRTPVDPETTAFRTGSVSKLITAAVVSQLIEEGKLDPRADINSYLDFRIPAFDDKPLTLTHLLTHTAGFDDRYAGKSARSFAQAQPLGAYLKSALPRRILPPGEVFHYSNYGVALAGYVAERAAGSPFADLAQERVFQPLGMRHSSFLLASPAATPYEWTGSEQRALPWDYLQDAPAGMQMSSGADMARFLQWALDHRQRPEFQPQFTQHPRLEGSIGWAWELGHSRGRAYAGHDGGYPGAVARVRLFPEDGVGYFIAANSLSGVFLGEAADAVESELLSDAPGGAAAKPTQWESDVAAFEGVYRDVRYSRDTLLKLGVLLGFLGGELRIGITSGGLITMPKLDGSPRRMARIAPDLFQSLDDDYVCAFRRDSRGQVTHLFTSGTSAMERVPAMLAAPVQRNVFLVCALALVLLMIGPVRRRLLAEPLRAPAGWAANAFAFQLLGLGLVLQVLPSSTERLGSYRYGFAWPVWIAQTLGLLGAACVGWLLVRLLGSRAHSPLPWLTAAALCVHTAWLWNWRLLGYWF